MKKYLIILALCAISLTGCVSGSQQNKVNTDQRLLNSIDDKILSAEYHGHQYIIYKGYNKGGITHDPDCPCHEKTITEDNPVECEVTIKPKKK